MNHKKVICIDLDRTFLIQDTTFVILYSFVLKDFRNRIFPLVMLLLKFDKDIIKNTIIEEFDYSTINWKVNESVLNFIIHKKNLGHKIHLVTGSNYNIAKYIAGKYKVFDFIHTSGPGFKLKGKTKAKYLAKYFGEYEFIYIGDSYKDIFVWKLSDTAYCPRRKIFKFLLLFRILNLNFI